MAFIFILFSGSSHRKFFKMKTKIFVVAALFIGSQLRAQAQDTVSKAMDEVVVTADKFPQKQSETGKVITVINHQQLERGKGKNLVEVLNAVAGINIVGANNNLGTNQTVNIRGSSSGNALILIDGIPLNDPSVNTNYFDLNFFSIDQIERIEILKGGQSTLYGSDAVAGVINIITRKPGNKKFAVDAGATAGSYNTFKESIALSGKAGISKYVINYAHLSAVGFSSAYDSSGNNNFDKDGFNQHVVSAHVDFKVSNDVEAKVFGSYSYYKTDLDESAFTDDKDYTVKNRNAQTGLGLTAHHNKGVLNFNYFFNYVSRDYLDDSSDISNPYSVYSKSSYIGRTNFAELYDNCRWQNIELLTGIDYRLNNTYQQFFSTGSFGPYNPGALNAKMWQLSPYASLILKDNKNWNIEMGARWNHHSEYGNNFTYTLNPSYLINKKVKIFANLYSAFKTPTLYQLFDPVFGNPNLKPEQGIVGEAGTEFFSGAKFDMRAVGYYRKSRDVIDFIIVDPSTFLSHYDNISKQENYGVELETKFNFGKWTWTGNYTYTTGKTESSYDGTGLPLAKDTSYYNLYRIPKHTLHLSLDFQPTPRSHIGSYFHLVSKKQEFIYGSAPLAVKGYATIDLYADYTCKKNLRVFIDLKNLTNKKYFDIPGYNSKRFNFTTGIYYNM